MDKDMLTFQKNAILGKIAQPLCQPYKQAWRACGDDKEMLVKLALSQQSQPYFATACYQKLGLSKEYILKNFKDYINGNKTIEDADGVKGYTYQIYVDYKDDISVTCDVISLMWCKDITLTINATKCPVLYISNASNVNIVCEGYNSPRIYLLDESKVTIEDCDENCGVTVYRYSDNAVVEEGKYCLGKVKVFNKQLKL